MDYEYDPAKNSSNIARHGMPLSDAEAFEWETAVVREDDRFQYDEQRFEATGLIGDQLHVMIYCERSKVIRIISLRKATNREKKRYGKVSHPQ
jgi:uncharacterized DUF497 family protein